MKVNLRQIPEGGSFHFEGEEDTKNLGLEEAGATPLAPLSFSLDCGISDGGFFATGRLAVDLKLRCVACMEPFEMKLEVYPFAMQKELDGREAVDLEPEIREDIQLAVPAYPRCDVEGRKTCPASFPAAPAEAFQPPSDAAWDALDKLKAEKPQD